MSNNKELEEENKELKRIIKKMSNDLDGAGNDLFIQEGKIRELEEALDFIIGITRYSGNGTIEDYEYLQLLIEKYKL